MITSYVSAERGLVYLSLVGSLNRQSASDLMREYGERAEPSLARCVLDLSGTDSADDAGLAVLSQFAMRTEVEGRTFAVLARGSSAEDRIRCAASASWIPLTESRDLPFVRAAS